MELTKAQIEGISSTISVLFKQDAIRATKYVSPTIIVRAVRKLYGKKIIRRHNVEVTLTVGRPNYLEREFIRDCKKAGEPFPIKQVQIKMYNPYPSKQKKFRR